MKVIKKHKFLLAIVLFALVFVIAASMGTYSVFARTVTIDGSNFFYANGDSSVRAHKETVNEEDNYYTMFHFASDEDNVTYRYNLAYHWYQASDADETVAEEGWFNLTIGFETADFDSYVIKFQSQQYSETKEGVTTNYIVFVSDGSDNVYCYITDDEDNLELGVTEIAADYTLNDGYAVFPVENSDGFVNRITIAYTGYSAGEYAVSITDENSNACNGVFTNVGGNYSKRVNSTTAGVMPLTFTAYLDEDNADASCDMVLFCLNNQEFLLSDGAAYYEGDDGDNGGSVTYYTGTSVVDDQPPVLCLEGNLTYVEYGEALDFDYVVIDVLASSPKSTLNYYILSAEIYNAAQSSGSVDYFTDNTTDDNTGESLFDKTDDDDTDYIIVESTDPFLTEDIYNTNGDNGYTVGCLVKVFVELTDVTSSSNNNATTKVYLDWYIDPSYLANVEIGGETCGFIMALTDEQGATYLVDDPDTPNVNEFEEAVNAYQAKIDELAYDDNGNLVLSAGSTSEIYLPTFEGFITDNLDGYEDLTYAIYYTIDGSQNSASSLSYNSLSISLSTAGTYRFTIYATDSASNNMYYIDADGELVEFTASEIYDDEVKDYLPWFTFDVTYLGVTVDDPGEQTTGYVGSEYSVSSFDINGVSGYYNTAYTLYHFDRTAFIEDTGVTLTYSEFVECIEALLTNTYFEDNTDTAPNGERYCDINTEAYFKIIKELSDLNETDPDYDEFADYEWSSSSLTFYPQDENAYYVVMLTVTDKYYAKNVTVYSYMGIHVSAAADSYAGESDWIANNLASVILFSIAGAALIAIIILFVIKPKEEGDLDEQLASEAEGIKAKEAKKTKKSKKKKDEE